MEEKKETIGQSVGLHQEKKITEYGEDYVQDIANYHLEQSDYIGELERTVRENKDKDYFSGEDFFIEVITRKEKLLPDTIRNQFIARKKCPSPAPASGVFHYRHNSQTLEFLWQLPRIERCHDMFMNKEYVPPEEQELLGYVIKFFNGELMKLAQELSGEDAHTIQGSVKIEKQ